MRTQAVLDAVAIKVQARQILAKRLAHAIQAVRARRVVGVNRFRLTVKARHMVGTGKHDTAHTVLARRFVQVIDAQNVGLQDRAERPLHRNAAQVDDGIHALHHGVDRRRVGQISQHDFFVHAGNAKLHPIRQAQHIAVGLEAWAQCLAQTTGSAGQQQPGVGFEGHFLLLISIFLRITGLIRFDALQFVQLLTCQLSDKVNCDHSSHVSQPLYMQSWKTPSAPEPRQRRPRGLVQEVVNSLAGSIRGGQIKPGDKLPSESEIMARFEVSRTVVREALSKLQASKLVETRHGIGTFALALPDTSNFKISDADFSTIADVIAVLELRISLETEAAGLAAKRRSDANLSAMQTALTAFHDAINQDSDAVPPDFAFHMEVAHATGNRHFADLMTYLGTMIIPRTRVNTPNSAPEGRLSYLLRVHGEHQSIFNAILGQDTEAARAAMRTHLNNSRERLRKATSTPRLVPIL